MKKERKMKSEKKIVYTTGLIGEMVHLDEPEEEGTEYLNILDENSKRLLAEATVKQTDKKNS